MQNLLKYQGYLSVREEGDKVFVHDPVRKKRVTMTPEEMVRQLFINFLIHEIGIPLKHIAVERKIKEGGNNYRFDILVFDKNANARMIVECKSYKVRLKENAGMQIGKYNYTIGAEYLCITNGHKILYYRINNEIQKLTRIQEFPEIG
jgi:hypothetical protein